MTLDDLNSKGFDTTEAKVADLVDTLKYYDIRYHVVIVCGLSKRSSVMDKILEYCDKHDKVIESTSNNQVNTTSQRIQICHCYYDVLSKHKQTIVIDFS